MTAEPLTAEERSLCELVAVANPAATVSRLYALLTAAELEVARLTREKQEAERSTERLAFMAAHPGVVSWSLSYGGPNRGAWSFKDPEGTVLLCSSLNAAVDDAEVAYKAASRAKLATPEPTP